MCINHHNHSLDNCESLLPFCTPCAKGGHLPCVSAALLAGTKYGPPGSKRLVYFVDDINMPLVDKYDTQTAIELMRQHVDQKGWFDKVRDTHSL